MIKVKSYFSGAGGLDLGLSQAGLDIIESYEIDKTACQTLKNNFTHNINQSDITKITVLDQMDADVYAGTFPCTKYSAIADIHGTRVGDELFLHFFRHIALAKPEAYIVENVPGMKKFQVVMECLTRLPDYYVRVECPVNANLWLPQERKRLIRKYGTWNKYQKHNKSRANIFFHNYTPFKKSPLLIKRTPNMQILYIILYSAFIFSSVQALLKDLFRLNLFLHCLSLKL